MYNVISTILSILLIPIWLPIALVLAFTYKWQDTVPDEHKEDSE